MAGFPVLGPIEHSVLIITLDGGHSEMTIDEEPLAHLVLDVTLEGRPAYGGDFRSGTVRAFGSGGGGGGLDSGLMEGMSHLEPLEHSVLNVARGNCSRKEASVCEPLLYRGYVTTVNMFTVHWYTHKQQTYCYNEGLGKAHAFVLSPFID